MSWAPDAFLYFAIFCITVSAVSSLSVRRPLPVFIVPIFIFGLLTSSLQEDGDLWNQASPMARVHAQAPPFFVVHGANDVMTSPRLARSFCSELVKYSQTPVAYAELPGCQHGFDGMHSVRTEYLLNHITDFLEWSHSNNQGAAL